MQEQIDRLVINRLSAQINQTDRTRGKQTNVLDLLVRSSSIERQKLSVSEEDRPMVDNSTCLTINPWLRFELESMKKVDRGSDRKSTRLNSSHIQKSRMPSSA